MKHGIKTYEFRSSLPLGFEITTINTIIEANRRILVSPHRTNFYSIIWFMEGGSTHYVDFKPIQISSNSLLFVGKSKVHFFDKGIKYSSKAIFFTDNFFTRTECDIKFLQNLMLFNHLIDTVYIEIDDTCCALVDLFHQMEKEFNAPADVFQPDILKNLLHSFLLFAERKKIKEGGAKLQRSSDLDYTLLFRDILEKEFRQMKSVKEYACRIYISERRLSQATATILGKLPKQLIDDRVLLEAKRLLVYSNFSIKEISTELGFEEPTNFIKYFRRHQAHTPTEFREAYNLK